MLPGLLREAGTQKVLYGFLQSCPEECGVVAGLLVLRRAEEVDHPTPVQAVPQEGVAHLAFWVRSEPA